MRYNLQTTIHPKPPIGWGRRVLIGLLSIYPLLLLGLSFQQLFLPRRAGVLALGEVFAPYLFLPLLLLLPFAFMRGATLLRIVLITCTLIFLARFGPGINLAQVQEDPAAQHITAMSWNIRKGGQVEEVRAVLKRKPADIVSILESGRWIVDDADIAQVYPYRPADVPTEGTESGSLLLSVYPILEQGVLGAPEGIGDVPRVRWARFDIGGGRTLVAVVAHPLPANTCAGEFFLPHCYDTAGRDAWLADIRYSVEPYLRQGEPLLLMGDFNVTDREPAYTDLSSGLLDAHRLAGSGFGYTWRPARLMNREIPLLRIDYIFSSPNLTPLDASTDCTPRGSDHCIVYARFQLK